MVANYDVTSTVVGMAHEMGHNFGANHDASGLGMMDGAEEGNGDGTDPGNGGNNGGNTGDGSTCIGIRNLQSSYGIDFNGYWQYYGHIVINKRLVIVIQIHDGADPGN
eukprot:98828_1